MKKVAFLCDERANVDSVFGHGRRAALAQVVDLYPDIISSKNLDGHAQILPQLDVAFSTWGMPRLTAADLDRFTRLQAIFYAAGSVKSFAEPLLKHGLVLCSGWGANAIPVAEFTMAQILLACKGYFRNTRECRDAKDRRAGRVFRGPGVFGETVGLIGLGQVGQTVARMLRGFELEVLAYDPYADAEVVTDLGVERVALAALFDRALVISNHLPNIPPTRGKLDAALFERMRPGATFINTGRGAQVVEDDLIAALQRRLDLTALLDVTFPEPPDPDSAFYSLPNVQLSSHIAGSQNNEVVRMADYMIEEFTRWERDEALRWQVTESMLATMA